MTLLNTLHVIRGELQERARIEEKRFNWFSYVKLMFNPPALAVVIYRFQYYFATNRMQWIAELLRRLNIILFTTDIGSQAQIGRAFLLYHANDIVITPNCEIGPGVHLVHHNSILIGPRPGMNPETDKVVIEENVVMGCGARVVGSLTIGHDSFIAANAVVTESLPPYSFYSGNGTEAER